MLLKDYGEMKINDRSSDKNFVVEHLGLGSILAGQQMVIQGPFSLSAVSLPHKV